MKIIFVSALFTSIIFLIVDILWLSFAVKNFYRPNLTYLLNEKPVMWAAIMFYVIYVVVLTILILIPAIKENSILQSYWQGALFGLVAYGTYNLTNMATVVNWSSKVVVVDMFWGSLLTGTSSALGLFLAKKFLN